MIRSPEITFSTTRFKEGYDIAEVDKFLRRIEAGEASAEDIRTVTFSTVRFRSGYDTDEVDDYLDRVIRQMGSSPTAPAGDDETPSDDDTHSGDEGFPMSTTSDDPIFFR